SWVMTSSWPTSSSKTFTSGSLRIVEPTVVAFALSAQALPGLSLDLRLCLEAFAAHLSSAAGRQDSRLGVARIDLIVRSTRFDDSGLGLLRIHVIDDPGFGFFGRIRLDPVRRHALGIVTVVDDRPRGETSSGQDSRRRLLIGLGLIRRFQERRELVFVFRCRRFFAQI